jgi:hypothetical protein
MTDAAYYTGAQFKADLKQLGLLDPDGEAAAWFLDVSERNVRRWLSDQQEVPPGVGMLLRLMIHTRTTPEQAKQWLVDQP